MSHYPPDFDARACDAAQGEPVNADSRLSAKLRVLHAALTAAENAIADLKANGWGDVLLSGVEASELLADVPTGWNANDAAADHAEREAAYLDGEAA